MPQSGTITKSDRVARLHASHSPAPTPQYRRRIAFADADAVRRDVHAAAVTIRPSCARGVVLRAVLKLLCGWSRVHDDRVRITQIIELCGPEHSYDPKTVGRALAALHREQFISYQPAHGRGRFAVLAIHPRFLSGIDELERDEYGKVVTFSRRSPYMSQRKTPPTPSPSTRHNDSGRARPTEVEVRSDEVRAVLDQAPPAFAQLPRHLRWCLGREVRTLLARGFTPAQILAVLAAPIPPGLQRPLRLAKWRFAQNLIGSGPRLAPLQRAWDTAQRTAASDRHQAEQRARAQEVFAVTNAATQRRMLDVLRAKLIDPVIDEMVALIHASRMAKRENPGTATLAAAIDCWLLTHAATSPTRHACDVDPAPAGFASDADHTRCVSCGVEEGRVRDELPLRSPVCDYCWSTVDAA